MADSVRLQILERIQDLLETVPGIGETSGVKRTAISIQSPPAAFIRAGDEEVTNYIGDRIDLSFNVEIETWVITTGNLLRAIEEFLAKVDQVMAADHSLGNLCINFGYQGASPPFSLNQENTQAGITLVYECTYRRKLKDPYTI